MATTIKVAHSEMTQLGQAETSRTIESAWWRSPALRGYRTKKMEEGRKALEKAREQSCLEKEYWKGKKNKEARQKHQL